MSKPHNHAPPLNVFAAIDRLANPRSKSIISGGEFANYKAELLERT
jgi:hypothetical protein